MYFLLRYLNDIKPCILKPIFERYLLKRRRNHIFGKLKNNEY